MKDNKNFEAVDAEEVMNESEEMTGQKPEKAHPVKAFMKNALGRVGSASKKVVKIGGVIVTIVVIGGICYAISKVSGSNGDAEITGAEATGDSEGDANDNSGDQLSDDSLV